MFWSTVTYYSWNGVYSGGLENYLIRNLYNIHTGTSKLTIYIYYKRQSNLIDPIDLFRVILCMVRAVTLPRDEKRKWLIKKKNPTFLSITHLYANPTHYCFIALVLVSIARTLNKKTQKTTHRAHSPPLGICLYWIKNLSWFLVFQVF